MKKNEIYVVIDSEEKRLRAIQILSDAGENIWNNTDLIGNGTTVLTQTYITPIILVFYKGWYCIKTVGNKQEITLDQLEQMLSPKQEIKMELDALKLIAESYGFELVEKEREIKVGDFGKFLSENGGSSSFGFLYKIIGTLDTGIIYAEDGNDITTHWSNFRHLTNEEKQQIQQNW
jgi:hypothetical protein